MITCGACHKPIDQKRIKCAPCRGTGHMDDEEMARIDWDAIDDEDLAESLHCRTCNGAGDHHHYVCACPEHSLFSTLTMKK